MRWARTPRSKHCAAVGVPDAYAGELPVVFATLRSGATATVDELRSFVADRVDEAPAKPKSITLITKMPMTNVGKIYKPELRLMAAQAVVTAQVNEVWAESKLDAAPCPRVRIDAANGIEVLLDEAALGIVRRSFGNGCGKCWNRFPSRPSSPTTFPRNATPPDPSSHAVRPEPDRTDRSSPCRMRIHGTVSHSLA